MKKFLFIVVCCLCLCGCNKNSNEYGVSEITGVTTYAFPNIEGQITNYSNNNCENVRIDFEYSSGSIKGKDYIVVNSPKIGESNSFSENPRNTDLFGVGYNVDKYKFVVYNIGCFTKESN